MYVQTVTNKLDKKNIKNLKEINRTRIIYIASDDQLQHFSKNCPQIIS